MIYHPCIASGGDILPVVIFIVVMVAKFFNYVNRPKPTLTPEQNPNTPAPDNPQDELRKFLESLGGGGDIPSAPHPAPPPVPGTPARPAVDTLAASPAPRVLARPDPAIPPRSALEGHTAIKPLAVIAPPPVPTPDRATAKNVPKKTSSGSNLKARSDVTHAILGQLSNRESLRKAIVLREILGPCLALRQPNT